MITYLGQYYLRNNSESGFSADKRGFGWKVGQNDRIGTALTCTGVYSVKTCTLINLVPQPQRLACPICYYSGDSDNTDYCPTP